MKTDLVKLPVRFDVERMVEEVARLDEQQWFMPPDIPPDCTALTLVGDPEVRAAASPSRKGHLRISSALETSPYLRQVLSSFATILGSCRLVRLAPGASGYLKRDLSYTSFRSVRVVIPVVSPDGAQLCAGRLAAGISPGAAWAVRPWSSHGVVKPPGSEAILLLFDTVGSTYFADLVAAGVSAASGERVPRERVVRHIESAESDLKMEANWLPPVMPPAEQERTCDFIMANLTEGPSDQSGLCGEFKAELERFAVGWQALCAEHGQSGAAGLNQFKNLLDRFSNSLHRFENRLTLANGADAAEAARALLVAPALKEGDTRADQPAEPNGGAISSPGASAESPGGPPAPEADVPADLPRQRPARARNRQKRIEAERGERPRWIERPVFIVAPPRSGTSLLFETLTLSPDFWTIGGESHAIIEGIRSLHPAQRGFESNRLTAADADSEVSSLLEARFVASLRDRDGNPPPPNRFGFRLLEKTPKNALRVPFLNAVFPEARFVYLYRDPRDCISSMLDAWKSTKFVTYPNLPRWQGPPWSLLLVPGWRSLNGHPLPEIIAEQWATTTRILLDDLEELPASQWCIASYERLVADPQAEVERLCAFVDAAWDRRLATPLPLARHTLTPPDPEKWHRNEAELNTILPLVRAVSERARAIFANPPAPLPRPARRRTSTATQASKPKLRGQDAGGPAAGKMHAVPAPPAESKASTGGKAAEATQSSGGEASFASVATDSFPHLLGELGISLLVSTYQSGRVIVVRSQGSRLNTHFRFFPSPMGIAVGPRYLAIGTQQSIWEYCNVPAVGPKVEPPGEYDACYLPRARRFTGDIRVHEMAFAGEELWIVNTRFSCLCTLEPDYSFVPRWRPPFVTQLDEKDRCHLNGLAVADGRVQYVTAHAETDTPGGWRGRKVDGGCLIDVATGETVARGLSMPHSPRLYGGRLWVLESGRGTLATVDPGTGRVTVVAEFPGFTRGLAFAGPFAFVGLSQVRESVFGGIPLCERLKERVSGVWVVDIRSGRVVAFLRFADAVQEIFDVQVLHGMRFPELVEPDSPLSAATYVLSDDVVAEVKRAAAISGT